MREHGDELAPDGGDSGADAVPEHADGARPARYEAVPDAAARKASALEYRQQAEARYAGDGHAGHARREAREADGSGQAGSETPRPGPDSPEDAAPPGEPADSWPPPRADQDRARQLYREYLADMASPGPRGGRDRGVNEAGPRPDQSPGEISGLPPPGDELTEMESSRKSRFSELCREAEKEENLDGLHDAVQEYTSTVQRWLSARPPGGHAEQPAPTHHPYITPWAPEHGMEAGDAAGAVLVAGILTAHMARWIDDRLRHREGDHDDSNR